MRRKHDNPSFPTVYEDIGSRPIVVRNEGHLKALCEEHGLRSAHLQNQAMKSRAKTKRPGYTRYRYNKKTGKVEDVTNE